MFSIFPSPPFSWPIIIPIASHTPTSRPLSERKEPLSVCPSFHGDRAEAGFIHRDLTGSHWLAASESVSSPSPLASVEMADLRPWKLPCVGVPNIRDMSLYICACLHAVCPALAPLERGKSSRTKGKHESSSPAYDLSALLGLGLGGGPRAIFRSYVRDYSAAQVSGRRLANEGGNGAVNKAIGF